MDLDFKIINPLQHKGWDHRVKQLPGASIFHSSGWTRTLFESYGYKPQFLTLQSSDTISALLPMMEVDSILTGRRGVSLPFTDYCEPLISREGSFEELYPLLIEHGRKSGWKYIELRGNNDLFNDPDLIFSSYTGHVLKLTVGEEKLFSAFRSGTKHNISKALHSGFRADVLQTPDALEEYYRLHCITRKKQGMPPQPIKFFRNLFRNIISKDCGFVVLVSLNGRNVSGAIFLHFNKKAVYKYGASDIRFSNIGLGHLTVWTAIRWYANRGFESFCFGRTHPGNSGLNFFKLGWRPAEFSINYWKYDLTKCAYMKSKGTSEHYRVFCKLPSIVSQCIGCLLYKHMG